MTPTIELVIEVIPPDAVRGRGTSVETTVGVGVVDPAGRFHSSRDGHCYEGLLRRLLERMREAEQRAFDRTRDLASAWRVGLVEARLFARACGYELRVVDRRQGERAA